MKVKNQKETKKIKFRQDSNIKKKKSKIVPWGRTLSTEDRFLDKKKPNSKKERPVVVVDTNEENLAVVPLTATQGKNRTELKGYENKKTGKKTYYKHYLEIEDNEGNPIQVNEKFKENHKNMDVSHDKVEEIRDVIFKKAMTKQHNVKQLDKFKKRK